MTRLYSPLQERIAREGRRLAIRVPRPRMEPTRMSGKPFLWTFRTRTPSARKGCLHGGGFFGGCQDTLGRCQETPVFHKKVNVRRY